MTWSARTSSDGGFISPSALAVEAIHLSNDSSVMLPSSFGMTR